ncbi:MAG: hypothetical protein A2Z72_05780 [Omnitrophica bacterium RBG_13_46_9]|nr:MAG: hypothetical protein A2Z72_05780 [Omnitrophica bacterium RBG_13_46_9]
MSDRPLRILMTADPELPVPPDHYGGIERIIHMLVCGLTEKGHEIHLFANPDSKIPAKLIPYRGRNSASLSDTVRNMQDIKTYVRRIGNIDIIHSFSRLAYLLLLMRSSVPKVQSYQRHITPRSICLGVLLGGKTLVFTACSRSCAGTAKFAGGRWVIIPNGVPIGKYRFVPQVPDDAPLVFLGRLERIKGPHIAIEIARSSGKKLIIAGNHADSGPEYDYFIKEILPHCDGKTIKYVGPVNDVQKNELLGGASALIFSIEWEEPFGIVMAEALACGTPVIGFRKGALPEAVQDGVNGFICDTKEEMLDAVKRIPSIDRRMCRKSVEEKFSDKVIVEEYLSLYKSLLGGTAK